MLPNGSSTFFVTPHVIHLSWISEAWFISWNVLTLTFYCTSVVTVTENHFSRTVCTASAAVLVWVFLLPFSFFYGLWLQ